MMTLFEIVTPFEIVSFVGIFVLACIIARQHDRINILEDKLEEK